MPRPISNFQPARLIAIQLSARDRLNNRWREICHQFDIQIPPVRITFMWKTEQQNSNEPGRNLHHIWQQRSEKEDALQMFGLRIFHHFHIYSHSNIIFIILFSAMTKTQYFLSQHSRHSIKKRKSQSGSCHRWGLGGRRLLFMHKMSGRKKNIATSHHGT